MTAIMSFIYQMPPSANDFLRKTIGRLFLPMVCGLLVATLASAGDDLSRVSQPLLSAAEIDYPPFCLVEPDGRAAGFSVELLRAALATMDRTVTFRTGPWAEVKGWLETGQVDVLPLVGRTPEREAVFDFTFPYMSLHGALVVRQEERGIQTLAALRGRQVAVMRGDNAEEFLRREDRGIELHLTATFEEALQELAAGRHEAVVVQRLVALRLLEETGLTDKLRIVERPIEGFRQDFCFAVRKGDSQTLALLNEGLALVMADGAFHHLHARWFAALELPTHRRIVVGGDANYPPFEYLDERGRPAGYSVELTRAIAGELGLDLEIRLGPWEQMVRGLESGEIDALQGMFYSPQRDLKFAFSQAHLVKQYVGVVRQGERPPPTTVNELAGRRLVVQRDDFSYDFLVEKGLGEQVSLVETQEEALAAVAAGQHEVAVVVRMSALHLTEKRGGTKLALGQRPLFSAAYCYAVRNDQTALLAQFSEGLAMLKGSGEHRRIYEKWLGGYSEEPLTLLRALRYSAMVLVPLLLILLAAAVWSWSLRRQVAQQTAQLRHRVELESLVSAISTQFLNLSLDEVDRAITEALETIGRFAGIDRSYVFLVSADHKMIDNTHEWCAAQIEPQIDTLKGIPMDSLPWWMDKLGRFESIHIPCVAELPVEAAAERAILEAQDIRSVLAIPLVGDNSLVGFIGFDSVRREKSWPEEDVGLLRTVGEVFVNALEHRRAEATLMQERHLLRTVIDNLPDAVYAKDALGRKILANRVDLEHIGLPDAEVLGKTDAELFPPEVAAAFEADDRLVLSTGQPVIDREEILATKSGEQRWQLTSKLPLRRDDGQIVGLVGIGRDITERKRAQTEREKLQAQLLQAQKMESVGRLAGGVAHDFNNMLGVILGYTQMALKRLDPADALHADLEEILKAAQRSANITRQLLAFARRQPIAPRVLDLNETVEGMLKMLRRLIGEELELAWLPGAGLWLVHLDPGQLDQLLANLCVNARDAITGVGKVTIETGKAHFDAAYCAEHAGFMPGDYVRLAVSDTGCGMDQDTLEHIFEPFFTTKEVGQGTGLGLAMVYGIVKQHEGFINVYSEPGQGTTFRIYLPRYRGETVDPAGESTVELPRSRGETVLVVEDEAAILKMGQRMLQQLGYRVLGANSPEEALRLAAEHEGRLELLITDVVMPQMNGRQLAERLLGQYPGLAVLFMSGYTANAIAHHGVLDEGVQFIQKPFSLEELAVKVREALEEKGLHLRV